MNSQRLRLQGTVARDDVCLEDPLFAPIRSLHQRLPWKRPPNWRDSGQKKIVFRRKGVDSSIICCYLLP